MVKVLMNPLNKKLQSPKVISRCIKLRRAKASSPEETESPVFPINRTVVVVAVVVAFH